MVAKYSLDEKLKERENAVVLNNIEISRDNLVFLLILVF